MNKLILFFLSLCFLDGLWAQKKAGESIYILDTASIRELDIFLNALKEKGIGNNLEALKLFNQCIDLDYKNDAAYFEASQIDAELNNYQEAIAKAEKAFNLSPDNKFYLEHYTELLTKTGQLEKAIDVMKSIVSSKKADPILKLQYAYLLGMSKNPKKALSIFDEMEKAGEYNEAIAYEKVKLYLAMNDLKNAENELKKIVKNNPDDLRHLNNLADFYLKSGNIEEAERAFNDILRIEPNNVNALLYKVQYFQMKKDEENYRKTIISLVNNKDLSIETKITVLSDKFSTKPKLDSSEKKFLVDVAGQLLNQYPDDYRSYQIMGDMQYIAENYQEAIKHYKEALKINNNEYNIWQNLFYSLSILKDYKQLADSSASAMDMFPANALVYFYNGTANAQIERYDLAEKSYRRGLRFVGENKALEAQLYSSLADMYFKQKRHKDMDESFEEAIKLDPDNAYTLNNFAYYLSLRKDKLEYAKKMSRKSLDIEKDNPSFLDTYAWINFILQNYMEAKYYQEQALEHGKEDMATIYEHYGDILIKLNDKEKALKYWNMAKDAGSKNKSLSEKISTQNYVEYKD